MSRDELVALLRSIPEYETERVASSLPKKPKSAKEVNPYARYRGCQGDGKLVEITAAVGLLALPFRVKSVSTVNDILCTALCLIIDQKELASADKETMQLLLDIRAGSVRDRDLAVFESGDSAVLDKQCSLRYLSRSFALKKQAARTVKVFHADSSQTEVLRLIEGMTIGDLRKAKDLTMSYHIREGSDPDKDMTDDLLIAKDLIIEHASHKDELTVSKDFQRSYAVTQRLLRVIAVEGVLQIDAASLVLNKPGVLPKKEIVTKISLNQIVDVIILGAKTKIVYTQGSNQKTLRFVFQHKEDVTEFTKYCTLLCLSAQ